MIPRRHAAGPACDGFGGTEPTVTDVVLGYINPESYFGARMALSRAKAEPAIRDKIARPLGTVKPPHIYKNSRVAVRGAA